MKSQRALVVLVTLSTFGLILLVSVYLRESTNQVRTLSSSGSSCRSYPSLSHENIYGARLLKKLNFITKIQNFAQGKVPSPETYYYNVSEKLEAPVNCSERNCRENLSASERESTRKCAKLVRTRDHYKGPVDNNDCKFLPGAGRHPVALVSAHGSGNTWTRGLLEKASGICTGFIYCDTVMRAHGYVGETVKSGKVLVVKTHSSVPKWRGERNTYASLSDASYAAAMFIIRNPAKSAIAEWNRRCAGVGLGEQNYSIVQERHTYNIPRELFEGKQWDDFLDIYMRDWSDRLHNWVIDQVKHPVHILRYEDLQEDTVGELEKALNFLNVSYNIESVRGIVMDGYPEFHRKHDSEDFEHFTLEQRQMIRRVVEKAKDDSERADMALYLRLDEYLAQY